MAGKPFTFTPLARAEFLEELSVLGVANAAAAAAGIPLTVAIYHRQNDPTFAAEWASAIDRHGRTLMQQVRKMALDGLVTKEVRDAQGNVVVQERKYSERILLAYLRRMETGSWAERVAVEQTVTGTVEHKHSGRIVVEHLNQEQRNAARAFLATLPPTPSLN